MSNVAPTRRPVTAHEVAKLAGVSQSAVSRVFTPGASASPATRERVLAAAEQLGYRPNLVARSLIMGRSHLVGVVVTGNGNPFYQRALELLSTAFADAGYRVLLFTTDQDASSDPVLEEVLHYRVDALVLVSTSLSSRFAEECLQIGLPVVMFNRKTDSGASSSVTGENRKGGRLIAEFLVAGGHRRFAYVAGSEQSSTSRDRESGFMHCLGKHGVTQVERQVGHYSTAGAEHAVRTLLALKRAPDAIFCANDHMALVAISVARAEFGLTPGTDVSIVGFDDIATGQWPLFGLTTYSQPVERMVERTVDIVMRQIDDANVPSVQEVVGGQLIVRTSARKPDAGLRTEDGICLWAPPKPNAR